MSGGLASQSQSRFRCHGDLGTTHGRVPPPPELSLPRQRAKAEAEPEGWRGRHSEVGGGGAVPHLHHQSGATTRGSSSPCTDITWNALPDITGTPNKYLDLEDLDTLKP